LPAIGGERRFDYRGRGYIALGPEQPAGREAAELIFAVDGTQIRLSSSELSLERLLAYAEQLVADSDALQMDCLSKRAQTAFGAVRNQPASRQRKAA
jgi:hypothetical protein